MRVRLWKATATLSFAVAAISTSTPALAKNGATLAIISCSSLSSGCLFSGNINTNSSSSDPWSYTNVQGLYNASYDPDITLNPLANFDKAGSLGGITLTENGSGTGGTFTLAPGVDLDYYAVKAGDYFMLYAFTGGTTGTWTTSGITVGKGQTPALSHIIFFGDGSAVPEPSTWAMMLLGFGAIGIGVRRRPKSLRDAPQPA